MVASILSERPCDAAAHMMLSDKQRSSAPRGSLSEDAFETVRRWILEGQLEADTVVIEREVALRLGLSRTPVRDALRRLVGEGLLRQSGRTIMVNAIRTEDVLEILVLRRLLEGEGVKLATHRISPATLDILHAREVALLRMEHITAEAHWDVDNMFHATIAEASGNRLLARNVNELRERTRLYGFDQIPQRLEPGRQEHCQILDAMRHKDAERASMLMQRHLQQVADAILNTLAV